MPETATADILREPRSDTPEAKPSEPKSLDVMGLLDRYTRQQQAFMEAFGPQVASGEAKVQAAEAKAAKTTEEVVKPGIARLREAASEPLPPLPQVIEEPPVRSQRARPFLSTDGKDTLSSIISGLGLLAQMAMAGKAPVAALNAMTGAMKGWTAGDQERAERDWREYLGTVDRIRHENAQALRLWDTAMREHSGNLDAARMRFAADTAEAGLDQAAVAAAEHGMQRTLDQLKWWQGMSDALYDKTLKAMTIKSNEELRLATLESTQEARRQGLQLRWAELQRRIDDAKERAQDRKLSLEDRMQWHKTLEGFKNLQTQVLMNAPQGSLYWDEKEGRAWAPSRGQLLQEPDRFKTKLLNPQVQLVERLAVAGPLFDALDKLIDNINAAAPGENITQGLLQRLQYKAGIGEDIRLMRAIAFESGLEVAAAVSGGGGPRLGILYMLRDEAQPNEFLTRQAAHSVNNAGRVTVTNRLAKITHDAKAFEKLRQDQIDYDVPDRTKALAPPAPHEGMVRVRRKSDGMAGWIDKGEVTDAYEVMK